MRTIAENVPEGIGASEGISCPSSYQMHLKLTLKGNIIGNILVIGYY